MHIDSNKWRYIPDGKEIETPRGIIHLRVRSGAQISVTDQSGEVLVFSADASGNFRSRWSAPAKVKVEGGGYLFYPEAVLCPRRDEVFTNLDRRPSESGSLFEVTRALRLLDLKQLEHRREQASLRAAFRADQDRALAEFEAARNALTADPPPAASDAPPDPVATP